MTPAPAGLHPGWRSQRAWQHLQTDFGGGLGFLNTWAAWRQDEARPDLLHVVGLLDAAPHAPDLLSKVHSPTLVPLAKELALQCRGLVPGVHRLSFETGQVLLTLCVGQPWTVLREQELQFDSIEAEAANAPDEGQIRTWLQQLARCCKPAPPDDIRGFITRGKGVSIHRSDCSNLREFVARNPERVIEVEWGRPSADSQALYPVDVAVQAADRQGLLRDISEVFAKEKMNVVGVQTQSVKGVAWMTFTVEISDSHRLNAVLTQVREVAGVRAARRR